MIRVKPKSYTAKYVDMLILLTPTECQDRDVGVTNLQSLGLGAQPDAHEQKPPAAACDSFQA